MKVSVSDYLFWAWPEATPSSPKILDWIKWQVNILPLTELKLFVCYLGQAVVPGYHALLFYF